MSLLSAVILPKLEKELMLMEPEIAECALKIIKMIADEVIIWLEQKNKEKDKDRIK